MIGTGDRQQVWLAAAFPLAMVGAAAASFLLLGDDAALRLTLVTALLVGAITARLLTLRRALLSTGLLAALSVTLSILVVLLSSPPDWLPTASLVGAVDAALIATLPMLLGHLLQRTVQKRARSISATEFGVDLLLMVLYVTPTILVHGESAFGLLFLCLLFGFTAGRLMTRKLGRLQTVGVLLPAIYVAPTIFSTDGLEFWVAWSVWFEHGPDGWQLLLAATAGLFTLGITGRLLHSSLREFALRSTLVLAVTFLAAVTHTWIQFMGTVNGNTAVGIVVIPVLALWDFLQALAILLAGAATFTLTRRLSGRISRIYDPHCRATPMCAPPRSP